MEKDIIDRVRNRWFQTLGFLVISHPLYPLQNFRDHIDIFDCHVNNFVYWLAPLRWFYLMTYTICYFRKKSKILLRVVGINFTKLLIAKKVLRTKMWYFFLTIESKFS